MSGPRVLPEYYGPNGDQIANAFYNQAGRKRQNMLDTRAGKESDARLAESTYRLQHEQQIDPLEDAIRRATAREHGIMGPGEQGATDMQPGGQSGLPPVQMPQQPPPAAGPPTGKVMNPLYDMTPVEGTAHALPGAFNPVTGTHNPADVNLGGGYRLQGAMTPEGRRGRDASELAAAHIPGLTPELAMYLSDHPEHIAPFIQRAYGRVGQRWEPGSEEEALDYEGKLAALRHHETQRQAGQLTLEQALSQVDEAYSERDPISGGIKSSRLSMPSRMRLAQEVMHGNYSHLGASNKFGTAPLDRGQGGATSKRHITKDQQAYLQHTGKWDPSRYIVDPN